MPSHIEQRRRRWYAVLDIPANLRERFADNKGTSGGRRFIRSLQTESRSVALRRAAPLIATWKAEIEAERTGTRDPVEQDLKYWKEALADADPFAEPGQFSERDHILDHLRELPEQMDKQQDGRGVEFYKVATGELIGTTEHLEEYLATLDVTPKTVDMSRSDVKRLAAKFPTLDKLHRKDVRRWTDGLVSEDGLRPKTVARVLSACRGYWRYLQAIELAPEDREPFERLEVAKRAKKNSAKDRRREFAPDDVVRLKKAAADAGDKELADLICLGMWTGARIEELCSLKCDKVHKGYFEVVDAKTAAGWRQVPIHSKLKPTVDRLVKESADGYVLSGLPEDKYGRRSNAIGKRFGRLKEQLGFEQAHVFHSIRKTVVTILENAGVPEGVVADIVGHEKKTMTYGLYSGGSGMEAKQDAIRKLKYPKT